MCASLYIVCASNSLFHHICLAYLQHPSTCLIPLSMPIAMAASGKASDCHQGYVKPCSSGLCRGELQDLVGGACACILCALVRAPCRVSSSPNGCKATPEATCEPCRPSWGGMGGAILRAGVGKLMG